MLDRYVKKELQERSSEVPKTRAAFIAETIQIWKECQDIPRFAEWNFREAMQILAVTYSDKDGLNSVPGAGEA